MKTLLYFEECECNLSNTLFNRTDIDFVILRTTKNMKFFSQEYLNQTEKYKVFVADYDKDIEKEVSRFSSWCQENNITITNFLNDSEYYVEYANRFARELGLESLSKEQVLWVRDKVEMKARFRKIGLKTVDFNPVESKEDVINFFRQHNCNPIIFKPRRGMNSIDTYKIENLSDIYNLPIVFSNGKYMVEDFCYDQEWSIESLVQNGKVLDSYVTYIPNPTIWASISNQLNCHMTVPKIPSYFKFIPREFIQQIVSGMNLKNGTMTIEVFIDEHGNIKPSELGWRLPGCQATTNHSISYGINMYDSLIDIMIHKPVTLKYRNPILSVGDLYLPNKEGVVSNITPLSKLFEMDGVINGELFTSVGSYNKKRRVGNDASGWVQVIGKDENETLGKMKKIYDSFEIEVLEKENERSKVYDKKD